MSNSQIPFVKGDKVRRPKTLEAAPGRVMTVEATNETSGEVHCKWEGGEDHFHHSILEFAPADAR